MDRLQMPRVSNWSFYCYVSVIGDPGEALKIYNISRYCEDVYECVANNDIEPGASQRMKVTVECMPF